MILALLILAACSWSAGFFVWGWCTKGWHCRRTNPTCPVWQQERKRVWKDGLRKRYPNGSRERHPTTEIATLDNLREAGAPSERRDTPTAETDVGNPRRKT